MNPMNHIVNEQLKSAMGALHYLDDVGSTVLRIAIGERKPVITIDGPRTRFVRGAVKSRVTINGVARYVMATMIHGCQIEWLELREAHAQAVRS